MKGREHSKYQQEHFRKPALLEKYFHVRTIWIIVVCVLGFVGVLAAIILILDLTTNTSNTPLGMFEDIAALAVIAFMAWASVREYQFYSQSIWDEKRERVATPPHEITIEDIHMTLDCDGMSDEEIADEHLNKEYKTVTNILIKKFGIKREVARDFTKHFVDEENTDSGEGYFIDAFNDLVQHVDVDKNL